MATTEIITHTNKDIPSGNDPISLLKQLRQVYLYDIDGTGEVKTSISEIIELWNKVNQVIKCKK